MNNKGNVRKERLFIPIKERILLMSLGLLVTGLAHGVTGDKLGQDCRISSGNEGTSSRQQEELDCTPLAPESKPKDSSYQAQSPVDTNDAQAADTPAVDAQPATDAQGSDAGATDKETTDAQDTDPQTTDAQDTDPQTTDTSSSGIDGSAEAPEQPTTELFTSDIETSESAEGEERPSYDQDLFRLAITTQHTTDDFSIRTYSASYRNHRREWFWPWEEATTYGPDWGLEVDRSIGEFGPTEFKSLHLQGVLGTYITPGSYLQGKVGEHTLKTDDGERTIKSNSVTAMFGLESDFRVQLETKRDFLYPEGIVPAGITVHMTSRDYTASFSWRANHRLRLLGKGEYRKYDDENASQESELTALYGISPDWPWVWAGVGVQQLSFDKQVLNYWSPDDFTAYGLRFDASFPVQERLSASAAINLDRLDEDGSQGTGYYLQGGLQYRLDGQLYARLDLNQSKSLQRATTWTSDGILFSLSGPLF